MQLGFTEDSSRAVVNKAGEHIVALFGKEALNVAISLAPDSVDHFLNSGDVEIRRLDGCGMLYLRHTLYGCLVLLLHLFHLLLGTTIHHYCCLGEGGAVEHVHHHLQLPVLTHLPCKLILVLQLEFIGRGGGVKLYL